MAGFAPSSVPEDRLRCREILPRVSRTFALTIRVLPDSLRDPITVAYLLCRLADVVEDAGQLEPRRRIEALRQLAGALRQRGTSVGAIVHAFDGVAELERPSGGSARGQDDAAASLLRERATVERCFTRLPESQAVILGRWIETMALGMATFVAREESAAGGPSDRGVPFALETREELHLYAYYVAGTVGHLLAELFAEELDPGGRGLIERMRPLASPFGVGLQLTNILQDLAEDRKRGWSYVPEEAARAHGTSISTLDRPEAREAALRVVGELALEAMGLLDRALDFTLLIPASAPRVRLFCLWPIFFALRTLGRIWGEERVVSGGQKVRITRGEVRYLMGVTSLACGFDRAILWAYRRERARLDRRMAAHPLLPH